MATTEEFEAAVAKVKTFTKDPGNVKKLTLYGLYKQATVGDVTGKKYGVLKVADRAKWEAWASLEGVSAQDARADYVQLVEEIAQQQ